MPLMVRGVWNMCKAGTMGTVSGHPHENFCSRTRTVDPPPFLIVVQYIRSWLCDMVVAMWMGSPAPLTPSLTQAVVPSCQRWILRLKLAVMHLLWLYHAGVIGGTDRTKSFLLWLRQCDCGCDTGSYCCVFSHLCVIYEEEDDAGE